MTDDIDLTGAKVYRERDSNSARRWYVTPDGTRYYKPDPTSAPLLSLLTPEILGDIERPLVEVTEEAT